MSHGGLSWRVTPFCVRVSPGPSFRRQSPPSNPDFVPSPTFPLKPRVAGGPSAGAAMASFLKEIWGGPPQPPLPRTPDTTATQWSRASKPAVVPSPWGKGQEQG